MPSRVLFCRKKNPNLKIRAVNSSRHPDITEVAPKIWAYRYCPSLASIRKPEIRARVKNARLEIEKIIVIQIPTLFMFVLGSANRYCVKVLIRASNTSLPSQSTEKNSIEPRLQPAAVQGIAKLA